MMTVGELKAMLAYVPDDTRIVSYAVESRGGPIIGESVFMALLDSTLLIGHDNYDGAFIEQDLVDYLHEI